MIPNFNFWSLTFSVYEDMFPQLFVKLASVKELISGRHMIIGVDPIMHKVVAMIL